MPSAYMKIYLLRDFSILWLVFLIIWWKNELLTFFSFGRGSNLQNGLGRMDKGVCFIYSFTYHARLDSIWISSIKFLSVFVIVKFEAKSQEIWICDWIKIINIEFRVVQIMAKCEMMLHKKFDLNKQLHIVSFFLSVPHFCFILRQLKHNVGHLKEKKTKQLHIFFFHFSKVKTAQT